MTNIQNNSEDTLQYYVNEANGKLDLSSYDDWVKWGLAFASLGAEGKEPFRILSEASEKYDQIAFDKKFDSWVKDHNGKINIESFYHECIHVLGIKPYPNPNLSYKSNNQVNNISQKEKLVLNPKHSDDKWFYTLDEVMKAEREVRIWYFFVKGSNNAIVASSEAGKTTFVRNFATAVIMGEESFLGWELNCKRKQIILVSTEDGISSHRKHFERIGGETLKERVGDIRFVIDSFKLIEKLGLLLDNLPADLIFIDTWGDAVSGEYESGSTRTLMKEIRSLCIPYGATPVFIHHTNKGADNIPDKSSIKGAGDFEQTVRTATFITVYNGSRYLGLVKSNEHDDEEKAIMYKIGYDKSTEKISVDHGDYLIRQDIIDDLRKEIYGAQNKKDTDWEKYAAVPIRFGKLVEKLMEGANIGDSAAKKRITKDRDEGILHHDENTGLYSYE